MIVVCADDYGLSSGVCAAIEELIAIQRLSATSAMTGLPAWRRNGGSLRRLVANHPADVGLHLTLTDQKPLSPARSLLTADGRLPPVGLLTRRALAGRLPGDEVRTEIEAQLDAFEEVWGAPPDYVDGHQHVHVLPGIRGPLMAILAARYPGRRLWIRHCGLDPASPGAWRFAPVKAAVIGLLSRRLRHDAAAAGLATNRRFRGLYDFSGRVPYGDIFRACLEGPRDGLLVHCHPGHVDDELTTLDSLTAPREREFAYLSSDACAADLAAAGGPPARLH